MKNLLRVFALLSALLSLESYSQSCAQLDGASVYGQDDSSTYLGFFGSPTALYSIMNPTGPYGGSFSPLRRSLGDFSSLFSDLSHKSLFADNPPIIYQGPTSIAYLTTSALKIPGISLNTIDSSCSFTATAPTSGPITSTNYSANWLSGNFNGNLDAGENLIIGVSVIDQNGTTNITSNGVFEVIIRDDDGLVYQSFYLNALTDYNTPLATFSILNTFEGKEITFSFCFTDDSGYFECSDPYSGGFVSSSNGAPVILSTPSLTIYEDNLYNYNLSVSDPDGDSLTITYTIPSWLSFNGSSFFGTPQNSDVGSNEVTFTISDPAGLSDSQSFSITVLNTNGAPVILSTPSLTIYEDSLYNYNLSVSDPDGDSLTITYTIPSWLSFNGSSFFGTPQNSDVGSNEVTFTISDPAGLSDSQSFSITVLNTNDAPTIVSAPILEILEGESFNYTIQWDDPDLADGYNLSAQIPSWLYFNDETDTIYGQPTFENIGSHSVTITITDTAGLSDTQSFNLLVIDDPSIPNYEANIPAMGGIGLLALGLSMLGLGAIRMRRK